MQCLAPFIRSTIIVLIRACFDTPNLTHSAFINPQSSGLTLIVKFFLLLLYFNRSNLLHFLSFHRYSLYFPLFYLKDTIVFYRY